MHFARNIYGISWYAQLWKAFSAAFNIIIVREEWGKSVFLFYLFSLFLFCLLSLPLLPSTSHSSSASFSPGSSPLIPLSPSFFLHYYADISFFTRLGALRVYFMCKPDAWQMKSVKMPSVGAAINHTRRIVALQKACHKKPQHLRPKMQAKVNVLQICARFTGRKYF